MNHFYCFYQKNTCCSLFDTIRGETNKAFDLVFACISVTITYTLAFFSFFLMWHSSEKLLITAILLCFHLHLTVCKQYARLCEQLGDQTAPESENNETDMKLQRLRALCNDLQPNNNNMDSLPDFDLTRINSGIFI